MVRDSIKFRSGKFIGVCPEEVLGLNGDAYLQWVASMDDWSDKDVLNHIRKCIIADTEIQFGKFKGTPLCELKANMAFYWKWLIEKMQTDSRLSYLKYV